MQRVTLIDNYDSFTFNLVHYLGELGADVSVWRNDEITVADALADKPDAIVLSPGPCTPNEAGVCLDLGVRPQKGAGDLVRIHPKRQVERVVDDVLAEETTLPLGINSTADRGPGRRARSLAFWRSGSWSASKG